MEDLIIGGEDQDHGGEDTGDTIDIMDIEDTVEDFGEEVEEETQWELDQ